MNEETTHDDTQYSDIHRILLTHFRAIHCISQKQAYQDLQLIVQALSQEEDDAEVSVSSLLESYISDINKRISDHGFKIDKRNHELTGELYYIFINQQVDEVIKSNSNYSPPELDAIRGLIDSIIQSYDYQNSISKTNAQQAIASSLSRSLRDAQYLIMRLIDDGWFALTLNDHLILSLQSTSELKPYLISRFGISDEVNYGKLLLCRQCNDLVTIGYKCKSDECPISFHYKCYNIFVRNNPGNTSCISGRCTTTWTIDGLIRVGVEPQFLESTIS
ncbi:uncharacterized protein PRCAT00000351001 [Priceomyces carsonii]|uniref:uncharacterized protein n=1 Tax=Priceomyces carsonii TaxID=28549 RepID=UPI002EDAD219|nr:unnamed protein product [Priceomyces carsonii]